MLMKLNQYFNKVITGKLTITIFKTKVIKGLYTTLLSAVTAKSILQYEYIFHTRTYTRRKCLSCGKKKL